VRPAASVIRTYQIQIIPGLLQTEGYARALIRQGSAATEEEIARRGEPRASRQEIAGAHSAMGGPFTILRFAEPDLADVVYIEQLTSALYLDKPVEVDSYLEVMEQLCLEARPAASTPGILQQILAET